jgi:DNA-binding response OmpR family regulator
MSKILIVEDEPNMILGLKDNLEFEGYNVEVATNGEDGLKKILDNNYSLVLLDVMLPQKSGFDVCKIVRKKGIITPIILLTAKGEEIDKVLGLELGADDYVTKPFSIRELLARIKTILRRSENFSTVDSKDKMIPLGKLNLNFLSYTASEGKESIQMSHKEFDVLYYLWKNRNQTVSRDQLLNEVWGYEENPTTRTVDNFILKLRQKLEIDHNHPKIILTVHGIGYKLVD